jgi:hypothetical protein
MVVQSNKIQPIPRKRAASAVLPFAPESIIMPSRPEIFTSERWRYIEIVLGYMKKTWVIMGAYII